MEFLRSLLEWVISLLGPFVAPDWGALIKLIPLGVLLLVVAFYGWVFFRFRRAGPRRIGMPMRKPQVPAGIHLPGPSLAPFLISAASATLFFSVALGGPALAVSGLLFVLALVAWGREAVREYDALGAGSALALRTDQPADITAPSGPPDGVHLPPPSLLPLLVSAGAAVMLFGVAIGLQFALLGMLMTALALLGWLLDAGREYRAAANADATGHLINPTPREAPKFAIALFSLVFVFFAGSKAGVIGGSTASPSPSGAPVACAEGGTATVTICAKLVAFETTSITVPAGKPFTIHFVNKDAGIPHNVAIHEESGTGPEVYQGEIFNGADERTYDVPALTAGKTYVYVCTVHPNMQGAIVVQ
jgi:plastocyanin